MSVRPIRFEFQHQTPLVFIPGVSSNSASVAPAECCAAPVPAPDTNLREMSTAMFKVALEVGELNPITDDLRSRLLAEARRRLADLEAENARLRLLLGAAANPPRNREPFPSNAMRHGIPSA